MSIGIDHPDWQQITIWRADPMAAYLNYPLSSTNPYDASGWVTNWASLVLNIGPAGADGLTCTVTYYTDDTYSTPVSTHTWQAASEQTLKAILPNVANFVGIAVTTSNATAVDTNVVIQPMNVPVPSVRYNGTGNYANVIGATAPASSTTNVWLPYLAEGPGFFYFRDRGASGELSAGVLTSDAPAAHFERVAWYAAPVTAVFQEFYANGQPTLFQVVNADTAGHEYDYYLTVDGR